MSPDNIKTYFVEERKVNSTYEMATFVAEYALTHISTANQTTAVPLNLEAILDQDLGLVLVRIPSQTIHTILISHLTRRKAPI